MAGLSFSFVTRKEVPPQHESVAKLAGIIGVAPLIQLTYPAPAYKRFVAKYLSKLLPDLPLPAPVPEDVSLLRRKCCQIFG